ncbi:hypothetical protein DAEQUDRAFT_739795 [Daedalea quercina L-15889]|uniref:Peptidase C14 caspase domain-containing protein n=1 Tax=Daedalea quercina L-15889 TaxID=1314783 RepID=A0A165NBS2_9APHY|nr:hypothetical protein DAEQUDRAFT_739795 [Daedalea quercina L-15889]
MLAEELDRNIFALVIAIDKYKNTSISPLSGCTLDGNDFTTFLTETLHIPNHHIHQLYNEKATRGTIIDAFHRHLIENRDIKRGDAMVIFYAGHGARQPAPEDWEAADNMVEVICPHDIAARDAKGAPIQGIPDRTFGGLMQRLAAEKGNNILAIFDSCHSGGVSRSMPEDFRSGPQDGTPRSLGPDVVLEAIPETLDSEIWNVGDQSRVSKQVFPKGFRHSPTGSHVLLAACRDSEKALENRVLVSVTSGHASAPLPQSVTRGRFTLHLLASLRRAYAEGTQYDLTYARLMYRVLSEKAMKECPVPLSGQHPLCEGNHKDRLLFSSSEMAGEASSFTMQYNSTEDKLVVEAGRIHGVVEGTQFTLTAPEGKLRPEHYHATLTAASVGELRCVDTRATTFAWNSMQIKISGTSMMLPAPKLGQFGYMKVGEGQYFDASLSSSAEGWMLSRFDPLTLQYAEPIITISNLALQPEEILQSLAHFNYHLYRFNHPESGCRALRPRVELHRLERSRKAETGNWLRPALVPSTDKGDLFGEAKKVHHSPHSTYKLHDAVKEAEIYDMAPYYGLTLFNDSEVDLYPYVFYFDPSTCAIQTWYLPQSNQAAPPLPARGGSGDPGRLPIGYGASAADSIKFSLPDNMKRDTGFLKIFVSTTYVDMRSIARDGIDRFRAVTMEKRPIEDAWDASVYVLSCCESR